MKSVSAPLAEGANRAAVALADSLPQRDQGPLCVSLDRTLIRTNSLDESVLLAIKRRPWLLLLLPCWLLRGRAYLKQRLANAAVPDASILPYREDVLLFLRREKAAGRALILTTAANERFARAVADHLDLFDHVIASDARVNCAGATKLSAIRQLLGRRAFGCVGNSVADLAVWQASSETYLIEPSGELLARARRVCAPLVLGHSSGEKRGFANVFKALRAHQWVKNLLVLVPLFLAHQMDQLPKAILGVVALTAFCCCASAIYVLNDLLDIEADRRHPTKRSRPFAAGQLSPRTGLALAPALCLVGFGVAAQFVSARFCGLLAAYVLLTAGYSLFLKKQLVADVLLLAGLYTFRLIAGAVAVDVRLSPWLLAFSMFFFFSLALGKRYIELSRRGGNADQELPGRSYCPEDLSLLESIGPTSGYMAVLVFCLYIESETVKAMYGQPWLLWIACPILLYWITRFWLLARRRQIADDPVVFALRDRASVCSIVVMAVAVLLAKA